VLGFGSAGIGIANLLLAAMKDAGLSDEQARNLFYAIDRDGLLVEGDKNIRPDQQSFARKKADLASWPLSGQNEIDLLDVVRNVKPTVLIGVSGQPGAFSEEAIREMAKHADRPAIFPLSNPTSRSEATPEQLLAWTNGRALIGTGSPFAPVQIDGKSFHIDQTNNSYVFPGLALGIIASKAKRVSDAMIMTAAKTLAELSPTRKDKTASLLPPIAESRKIALLVAEGVAHRAIKDGLAGVPDHKSFKDELSASLWSPVYVPYERI
jgi:malate dehydrogenase (oxaloacetate-decarboxylating)